MRQTCSEFVGRRHEGIEFVGEQHADLRRGETGASGKSESGHPHLVHDLDDVGLGALASGQVQVGRPQGHLELSEHLGLVGQRGPHSRFGLLTGRGVAGVADHRALGVGGRPHRVDEGFGESRFGLPRVGTDVPLVGSATPELAKECDQPCCVLRGRPVEARQLPHRGARCGRIDVTDARDERENEAGVSQRLGDRTEGPRPDRRGRGHEEVMFEESSQEWCERRHPHDERRFVEFVQIRSGGSRGVGQIAILTKDRQIVGGHHPHHPRAQLGGVLLALVPRFGDVGRNVGVRAEVGGVDHLGPETRTAHTEESGHRGVDVEVAPEMTDHLRMARVDLVLVARAGRDLTVAPAHDHTRLPDDRPPERTARIGKHLTGIGTRVHRVVGARHPVCDPTFGAHVVPPSTPGH